MSKLLWAHAKETARWPAGSK